MISEISVHPKPSNSKAKISFYLFLALFIFSTAAYIVLRSLEVEKSGLFGLIPLISITVAIFFYNKYLGCSYYYDIIFDSEGTALFVVRQVFGKRASTLCRVALYEIVKIGKESAAERREHKTPKDHRKYSYLPTYMPETTYRIVTRSRYERAEIIIECSEEFAELLRSYSAEARAINAALSEEDY